MKQKDIFFIPPHLQAIQQHLLKQIQVKIIKVPLLPIGKLQCPCPYFFLY
jgi:hypothetical protein